MDANRPFDECIYDDLLHFMSNSPIASDRELNNLLSGYWGMLLFMVYYEQIHDINNELTEEWIAQCYNRLSASNNSDFSYCSGLSGIYWSLFHLHKYEFANIDVADVFSDYIKTVIPKNEVLIKQDNYDFLYGSTGICNLLVSFSDYPGVRECLEQYVKSLSNISISKQDGLSLPIFYDKKNMNKTDAFSLAHGTSAVQLVLKKIHKLGVSAYECENLIYGSMEFILKNENTNKSYSMFPSIMEGKMLFTGSRSSWCYGDLSVAISLWYCGKYFNEEKWKQKAMEILYFNSKRISQELSGVNDTCLCHGSAGIAAIYRKFWHETNDKSFYNCSEFWYNYTEKAIFFPQSLNVHGIKMWSGDEKIWNFSWNLLNGSAGVGLSLLSHKSKESLPWDEVLLIS